MRGKEGMHGTAGREGREQTGKQQAGSGMPAQHCTEVLPAGRKPCPHVAAHARMGKMQAGVS